MHKYRVVDPQAVYEPVEVEVPFEIAPTKQPQWTVLANYATVKAIAIEQMYGCPISDVDSQHVRDMFESVVVEGLNTTTGCGWVRLDRL